MDNLVSKKCVPCKIGTPPMPADQVNQFLKQVPNWKVSDNKITRQFEFKDFKESMVFINKVADIAQKEGHHPDIYIYYNKVTLELFTHAAGGLTENDFIVAAKIDAI